MGNEDLITDILAIVAGATADVPERLIGDIDDLSSIVSRRRASNPTVRTTVTSAHASPLASTTRIRASRSVSSLPSFSSASRRLHASPLVRPRYSAPAQISDKAGIWVETARSRAPCSARARAPVTVRGSSERVNAIERLVRLARGDERRAVERLDACPDFAQRSIVGDRLFATCPGERCRTESSWDSSRRRRARRMVGACAGFDAGEAIGDRSRRASRHREECRRKNSRRRNGQVLCQDVSSERVEGYVKALRSIIDSFGSMSIS